MTKKHIVIDARLYGPKHTGIGRYTKNLLLHLKNTSGFKNFNFTIIVYPDTLAEAKRDLGASYNYVVTPISHYSFEEQIFLPSFLRNLQPDLVHFTHFNKPLLYFGSSVVTIHDLIKHFYRGKDTTTRHPLFYWPKYLFYLLSTNLTIKFNQIIVPSNFWRDYLISQFHLPQKQVTTTYEAIDPKFLAPKTGNSRVKIENYILYTGNLYPHKNIDVILQALKSLPDLTLKIISARSVFSKRIETLIKNYQVESQVKLLGYIKDSDFPKIYSKALCLVHPSFMEGFSLTGLEAMALNCPVISSNTSCLPEIYHDSVLYFNPKSSTELVSQINTLKTQPKIRRDLISKGKELLKLYSWSKTASQTFSVYKNILQK